MSIQTVSNIFTYAPKITKALAWTVLGATTYKVALDRVFPNLKNIQKDIEEKGFSKLNGQGGMVFNEVEGFKSSSLLYTPHILVGLLNHYTKVGGYVLPAASVAALYFSIKK